MYEKRGNMDIYYLYDTLGNLSAIRYADGTVDHLYYAVCNSRGDVEAFYNGSGTLRARYIYDSWGNVIKAVDGNGKEITDKNSVAYINPIRYRGYYFDSETGLYYLKSRYYDPQVGRFINADGLVSTGQGVLGNNMFAYCNNNPVNNVDPTGQLPQFLKDIANAICNAAKTVYNTGKKVVKAIKGSFQMEGGLGFGLGASATFGPVSATVSAYQDGFTKGIKNGDSYNGIKGHAGASVKVCNYGLSLATEYEHRFSTNSVRDWDDHCALSTPDTVYNCEKTVKTPLQLSVPIADPVEGDLSEETSIGIGGEFHCIVGGHFYIGWDPSEFMRIMREE